MTTNLLNVPEDIFTAKNIALLLPKLDKDLATNIIFAGVSLNSQRVIEVIQACMIVASIRDVEAKEKAAKKAEEIVEKVMSQYSPGKKLSTGED